MNIVEIINLTTRYGKARGINNVSFEIKEGDIFGFIGPNGAGKSTTIRTLLGFLFPSEGSTKIFGKDCSKEIENIKLEIGYLPSEVNYYDDMKVKDLLKFSEKFYKKDYSKKINELVEIFQVDTNKRIDTLSLGNKKKVAIIQALLHEPKLLILDEPTSGLDPLMQSIFFDVLKKENEKGTTIFFSSHVLSEVQRVCNRVAIIKEGRLLKIEKIEDMINGTHVKVKATLGNQADVSNFSLLGTTDLKFEKNILSFIYNGNINELINVLSSYKLESLQIEEPTLEEIFKHYYEKE